MARAVVDIEREIRTLEPAGQERLLRALIEEIEGPADPDVERVRLVEVQLRSRELDEGTETPVPADEVLARARSELERR